MKAIILIFVFCVSVLQAQEIQGILNYQIGGGVNITANQLMPIRNTYKLIEKKKRSFETYNQKHPKKNVCLMNK